VSDERGSGSSRPDPGDPDYVPAPRIRRPRRQRSVTESLLSIVLLLEAIVVFFVVLVFFGLKTLSPAVAFGGGVAAIIVILVTIALLRWPIGMVLGWLIQAALIALGVLNPVMYVVGAGFTAFFVWCFVRGRQIDARRRDVLASSINSEGDTP
jgi:amino acid transporter